MGFVIIRGSPRKGLIMKSKRVLIISLIFAVILALAVFAFFVFANKNCAHEWESWKVVKLSNCIEGRALKRESASFAVRLKAIK